MGREERRSGTASSAFIVRVPPNVRFGRSARFDAGACWCPEEEGLLVCVKESARAGGRLLYGHLVHRFSEAVSRSFTAAVARFKCFFSTNV